MVIASIDIQNGKVVQLKQGEELVLQRDNAAALAEEFDRYGEIAVIDLDAAMGKGSNIEMIKPLLRKAECRVGGGIRTPEQAKELVSLGARKIIVGSSAFRDGANMFAVNAAFLEAISKKIGRERLIVAVDARNGEIVVDGWKTSTGLDLFAAAKAVEPFAGELLFTCVEREGTMTGIDLAPVRKLRETVSCQITVAGGVSTLAEIEEIAALGCDVQLGMALYTGKINLADAFNVSLNWKKGRGEVSPLAATPSGSTQPPPDNGTRTGERVDEKMLHGVGPEKAKVNDKSERPPSAGTPEPCARTGEGVTISNLHGVALEISPTKEKASAPAPATPPSLLPLIVQSSGGQVLMTGFTDKDALAETFKRGNVCFHSRTRNKLWMKGENSGNILKLIRLRADCDRDALLATAQPAGPVCHTGAWSCFANNRDYSWQFLQDIIQERFRNPAPGSYTATLDDELVREKVLEEAKELCEAKTRDEIIWEAADLLYFSTVLMTRAGVTVQEIFDELDRRHKK